MGLIFQKIIRIDKSVLILFTLGLFVNNVFSQDPIDKRISKKINNEKSKLLDYQDISRLGIYADSIGSYGLILIPNKTVINSGDSIKIDIFVTGYGKINGGKILISRNPQIFENGSYLSHKINYRQDENGIISAVQKIEKFNENEDIISLKISALIIIDEAKSLITPFGSVFKDVINNPYLETETIQTEIIDKNGHPPLRLVMITKKEIPSGTYKINISFSYFNGSRFELDNRNIEIKIMSWAERNEELIQFFALLISVFTLIGMGYQSFLVFKKIYGFSRKRLKKVFKF